eukprot:1352673-Rhodomonas_salina.1
MPSDALLKKDPDLAKFWETGELNMDMVDPPGPAAEEVGGGPAGAVAPLFTLAVLPFILAVPLFMLAAPLIMAVR